MIEVGFHTIQKFYFCYYVVNHILNTIWVFSRDQCGIDTLEDNQFQKASTMIDLFIMWVDIPWENHGDSGGIDQRSWLDIFMEIFYHDLVIYLWMKHMVRITIINYFVLKWMRFHFWEVVMWWHFGPFEWYTILARNILI